MKKIYKLGLILFGIGIISGVGTYLYVFHKPHRNLEKEKPAFVVDAQIFYNEFINDEEAAYTKYGNLAIQVSGQVAYVSIGDNGATINLLDEMEGISCSFDSLETVKYNNYLTETNIGDNVTLKGQCDGYDMIMGVVLTRCVPVNADK